MLFPGRPGRAIAGQQMGLQDFERVLPVTVLLVDDAIDRTYAALPEVGHHAISIADDLADLEIFASIFVKRPIFASSNGASISSSTQNGLGFTM